MIKEEAIKLAPPVTLTGMNILGYSVADWASAATLVYMLVLLGSLVRKELKK